MTCFSDFQFERFLCMLKTVVLINFCMQAVCFLPSKWVAFMLAADACILFGLMNLQIPKSDNTFSRAQEWIQLIMSKKLKMLFISHRGQNPDAPGNTMAAFKLALDHGARALEMDLHLSKDNQIVLIHDSVVDTTTTESGPVSSFTAQQLRQLTIKHVISAEQDSQISKDDCYIPRLCELIEYVNKRDENDGFPSDQGTRLVLDVKDSSSKMVEQLVLAFRTYPELYNTAIVAAFNPILLYNIRKADPTILVGLTIQADFCTKQVMPSRTSGVLARICDALDLVLLWINENLSWLIISNSFCLIHKDLMCPATVS